MFFWGDGIMKKHLGGKFIGLILAAIVLGATYFIGGATDTFEDMVDNVSINPVKIGAAIAIIALLYGINAIIKIIFGILPVKKGRLQTLITVMTSFIGYILFVVAFCWSLAVLGVNVSTIFAGVGILALIIGFGTESLVADLVTGVFILFENQFNVGDIIEVDGYRGTVDSIGIRTTCIRDPGGNIKIINNSSLKNILNRSEKGSVAISEVGVSYATDLREVDAKIADILADIKERNSEVFIGEVKYLGVENLADSAVVLKFMAEVEEKNIFSGRRLLNKELKCAFDDNGFEIAFPQIDVHMKPDAPSKKGKQASFAVEYDNGIVEE